VASSFEEKAPSRPPNTSVATIVVTTEERTRGRPVAMPPSACFMGRAPRVFGGMPSTDARIIAVRHERQVIAS